MYNSMEDQGQHYDQCVAEIKKCKLLTYQVQFSFGSIGTGVFNDDPTSKLMSRFEDIGFEYEGTAETHIIHLN